MRSEDRIILIGKLGKPHGIKGFCYFHYYGSEASIFKDYKNLIIDGEQHTTDALIEKSDRLILKLKDCNDRNAAERLRDKDVYISEKDLAPLDDGEYYLYQLHGLEVINLENKNFGKIDGILGTKSNEVLIIKPTESSIDDTERLIPYVKPNVIKDINLDKNIVKIDWPETY